jgi:hypothetical protein
MNPKELRIGNVVNFKGKKGIVFNVCRLDTDEHSEIYLYDYYGDPMNGIVEDVSGIRVDELTLKDYGFIINGDKMHIQLGNDNTVILTKVNNYWIMVGGSSFKYEFIHQFQNLYFALTGEELNVPL